MMQGKVVLSLCYKGNHVSNGAEKCSSQCNRAACRKPKEKKDITNQWSRGKKKPMEHKIEEVRQ